ncbi:MAG TPA: RecQ family zinc-binding domain-containing protein, partial [Bacteroidales bacterium]|nr:RecQ family zinc-binding domain-containing protein [Bacteroidales bacterium]
RAKESLEQSYPEIDFIKRVYDALGNYFQIPIGSMEDRPFDMNVKDFADRYGWKTLDVFHALRFLEKDGYILMNNSLKNASRLFISKSKETLYKFQLEYERYDRLIKVLLRSYSGLFSQYAFIDEKTIARRAEMTPEQVVKGLKFMEQQQLLRYIPSSGKPQLTYTQARLEQKNVMISPENYHRRLEQDRERLEAMLDYLETNSKCRSQQLLAYFGEQESVRCGKCDVCLRRNKVDMSRPVFDEIVKKIRPSILQKPLSEAELEKLLSVKEARQLTGVLRFLIDSNKIEKDGSKYFWKKET